MEWNFPRYLAAKKSVDDRALNKDVWRTFLADLPPNPRLVEVGAGIGTMAQRLFDAGLTYADYTAVDNQPDNIRIARQRLAALPATFRHTLHTADLLAFAAGHDGRSPYDALIAHAVLDLLDIPTALPLLWRLLPPNGRYYFTLNFDGATILEPAIDPALDALIEQLYHQSMDERLTDERPSGDSHSGRHLFTHLRHSGAAIHAAGSSDWVVFAGPNGYPADEAYFLHFIIHFIEQTLAGHPQLPTTSFAAWIKKRRAQIERGELIYIAHQLDIYGTAPAQS
jgi:SAM-dependent methyltransferase